MVGHALATDVRNEGGELNVCCTGHDHTALA
jgi:hypothetical protein